MFYLPVPLSTIPVHTWVAFGSIDDILSRPIFSTLGVVEICAPYPIGVLSSYFAPYLPRCHARGILRFHDRDEAGFEFP
jgi:hypothetical protein